MKGTTTVTSSRPALPRVGSIIKIGTDFHKVIERVDDYTITIRITKGISKWLAAIGWWLGEIRDAWREFWR